MPSNAASQLALPVGKVGFVQRQVNGLPIVVVEADTDARCLADGGKTRTRQLDEEFVFIFIGAVCLGDGARRILRHGFHLPCGTVRVEDDIGEEFRLIKAVVPEGERCALEPSLARVGRLEVDARVGGETARTAMVDPVGVGETEDADNDEEKCDEDDESAEQILHRTSPFNGFVVSGYYNIGESFLSAVWMTLLVQNGSILRHSGIADKFSTIILVHFISDT